MQTSDFQTPCVLSVFSRKGKAYKITSSLEVLFGMPGPPEVCGLLIRILEDDSVVDEVYFKIDTDLVGSPETVDLVETQMLLGLNEGSLTP